MSQPKSMNLGSPPPMRGKEEKQYTVKNGKGITPAYAGKSCVCDPAAGGGKDHPRLCGEKKNQKNMASTHLGSPPPMRGKGILPLADRSRTGITPAYAGKS